jgi:hypothetical protein
LARFAAPARRVISLPMLVCNHLLPCGINQEARDPLDWRHRQNWRWGSATGHPRMRDPSAVATIVGALRQVHGDDLARVMLQDGMTLAVLIDALLHAPLSNHDAAKLMNTALQSGDFDITPDFTSVMSHLKYVYDSKRSFKMVDIVMLTKDRSFASTEIRLRLRA